MEQLNTTDDVIVDDVAVDEVVDQTTDSVTIEGQDDSQVEVVEKQPEERDDYYKNRSFELERKLSNLAENIPKIVEESVIKSSQTKKQTEEIYTTAQLEQYALENPDNRPWVEEQKAKNLKREFKEMLNEDKKAQKQVALKQQSETRVLNDQRYAEAFVQTPNGQKQYNPNSPLAHAINGYMNDPRIKGLPDALEVAAKLAYADNIYKSNGTKEEKLTTLKRQNTKLKQQTMVESGGVQQVPQTRDSFQSAQEQLAKTGNTKDATLAVKEYLRKIRK